MNNKEYQKQHYLKNREKYLEKFRQYKLANRTKILAYKKKNRDETKEQTREYRKAWRLKNKESIAIKKKEYRKKYMTNPLNKLASTLRGRVKRAISKNYRKGSGLRDLGCSVSECKKYLESLFQPGMTWENYGIYGWHIDHKIPLSKFDLTNPIEFKKACHYTNLQPLWARDNLVKGSKI